jgi:hypothetical protein
MKSLIKSTENNNDKSWIHKKKKTEKMNGFCFFFFKKMSVQGNLWGVSKLMDNIWISCCLDNYSSFIFIHLSDFIKLKWNWITSGSSHLFQFPGILFSIFWWIFFQKIFNYFFLFSKLKILAHLKENIFIQMESSFIPIFFIFNKEITVNEKNERNVLKFQGTFNSKRCNS